MPYSTENAFNGNFEHKQKTHEFCTMHLYLQLFFLLCMVSVFISLMRRIVFNFFSKDAYFCPFPNELLIWKTPAQDSHQDYFLSFQDVSSCWHSKLDSRLRLENWQIIFNAVSAIFYHDQVALDFVRIACLRLFIARGTVPNTIRPGS